LYSHKDRQVSVCCYNNAVLRACVYYAFKARQPKVCLIKVQANEIKRYFRKNKSRVGRFG